MKVKTSELIGAALDWAVDKAEDRIRPDGGYYCGHHGRVSRWSTDWSQGGPIIEREGITLTHQTHKWAAQTDDDIFAWGATPLIAAMRCYVASKLGDEVDVPEELL